MGLPFKRQALNDTFPESLQNTLQPFTSFTLLEMDVKKSCCFAIGSLQLFDDFSRKSGGLHDGFGGQSHLLEVAGYLLFSSAFLSAMPSAFPFSCAKAISESLLLKILRFSSYFARSSRVREARATTFSSLSNTAFCALNGFSVHKSNVRNRSHTAFLLHSFRQADGNVGQPASYGYLENGKLHNCL